jgi:phage terminase large subunit-like protein
MSEHLRVYHAAAQVGEVIIGSELMLLLDRLTDDIEADRYAYDTTEATRRMDFMERCIRLTKSPFYGQPMRLLLWQQAYIEALYSFKLDDGRDRFWRSLLMVARKNAKSEMSSALSLCELIVGSPGAEIVQASNDDNQSSILFEATDIMRKMIDPRSQDTWRNNRWMKNLVTDSKVYKLSQRTANKEGRSIDFSIIDECHEMRDNSITKAVEQSMSLKPRPKLVMITTEGFTNDGFLDNELVYARKVLAGEIADEASERFLPWLYSQDDEDEIWRDEASWAKSNPSIDAIKQRTYLREQLAKARESRVDRAFVLCKDFNIKQSNSAAWLSLDDYSYPATFDLADFAGSFCLGAVDLSETTDLTCAKVLLMRPDDDTKYIHTMYFIPADKLERSDDATAGAQYRKWAEDGWLTITEGNDLDLTLVADWFYQLYDEHGIRPYKVGYDQRFAKQFLRRMDDYGIDVEMINQNAETLGNAVRLVEADLHGRKLNYNESPVDRWCLANAALKVDNRGFALIVKPQSRPAHRIDGAVTFAILLEIYRRYRTEFLTAIN